MRMNEQSRSPTKRCQNCALPCNGMFCCEWCMGTYLARRNAHDVARRERAALPSKERAGPESDQSVATD